MITIGTLAALCFVGVGFMFILLSIPLIAGRVKPNGLYGYRTRKTLSSEPIWYEANRFMGRELIKAGRVIVIGSACLAAANLIMRENLATIMVLGMALTSFCVIAAIFRSMAYVTRL
ncbi:MAG: SdpI family protein [Chthonomonadales bacterium]